MATPTDKSFIYRFFERIEDFFDSLTKIDNSKIAGFIFAAVLIAFMFACWYWVLFMNGAQSWRDGMIQYSKKFGIDSKKNIMVNTVFLKILVTLMLLICVVSLYFAVVSTTK